MSEIIRQPLLPIITWSGPTAAGSPETPWGFLNLGPEVVMPSGGRVFGIRIVRQNLTAGVISLRPSINGVAIGTPFAVAGGVGAVELFAPFDALFQEGDGLGVLRSADAAVLPTPNNIMSATVVVVFNRGVTADTELF